MPTLISSQQLHIGRAFSFCQDRIQLDNGVVGNFDYVKHPGGVAIVPIDADGQVLFVRQYRPVIDEWLLEIPAGTRDADEAPLMTADRELQEEVGMRAGYLHKLAQYFLAPGYSSELLHLFVATELTPSQLPQDEDEQILVTAVPITQALQWAMDGTLQDAKSIVGVLLAAQWWQRSQGVQASPT
ncbi:MAG TPA: NUDIX hydrolase [Anaerolineales bacterium]|nr:NUDIX hydrolase [Anaerolineales bacterium]